MHSQDQQAHRKTRPFWRIAAAGSCVAAAILLAGCGKDAAPAAAGPLPVTVAHPTVRSVTDWDEFTGRFQAVDQVEIRARVTGFIESIGFKDGAIVKAGDVLYAIDPRQYEAAVEQAQGQLDDAKAKLELTRRELTRATTLVKTEAVSQDLVDQRQQAFDGAQAAILQGEAALKRAQLDLEYTKVKAPIEGRIGRHLVSVGNLVQGSETGATLLASIVSLDPIHVYFDMDETIYQRNSRLWFEGKRPSSRDTANPVEILMIGDTKPSHAGTMDFLDNSLDQGSGTLRGRALVKNQDLSLLPGQFGRVRVIASSPYQALLLPDTAIAADQSRKIVFVVKKDDTVEAKQVVLGPLNDGLRIIRSGLSPEDRVVVDGLQRAQPGAKVMPHEAASAAAGGKL